MILKGYSLFNCMSLKNCLQIAVFFMINRMKGMGLNLQPSPEVLHFPYVVQPRAIILPDLTSTYP